MCVGERLLCGGEDVGGVFLEFFEECLRLEAEDTGVPIEVASEQVLFCGGAVGFFDEALNVLAVGFDVAVACLGACRRDAECHEVAFLGEFLCTQEDFLVFVFFADDVVGWADEHDFFWVHGEAGERDGGCCVAANGFQQEHASLFAFGFELILGQEELVGVRDDELCFACGGVCHDGLAEKGLPVKERGELLGHEGAAYGPQAGSTAATKNQVDHGKFPFERQR